MVEMLPEVVRSALAPGERVAWLGRPVVKLPRSGVEWILIVWCGLWTCGVLAWMVGAVNESGWFAASLASPMLAVGLCALFFSLSPGWLRARTWYLVTDRRALIVVKELWLQVSSIDLADPITVESFPDGDFGRLEFKVNDSPTWHGRAALGAPGTVVGRFLNLQDPEAAHRVALESQRMAALTAQLGREAEVRTTASRQGARILEGLDTQRAQLTIMAGVVACAWAAGAPILDALALGWGVCACSMAGVGLVRGELTASGRRGPPVRYTGRAARTRALVMLAIGAGVILYMCTRP